jgi:hypothetical protein
MISRVLNLKSLLKYINIVSYNIKLNKLAQINNVFSGFISLIFKIVYYKNSKTEFFLMNNFGFPNTFAQSQVTSTNFETNYTQV